MSRKIVVPEKELYQKYIVENMPRKECALYFGVSEKAITRRLSEYGIKRDTKMTYLNRKKAMKMRYGVEHPIHDPTIAQKTRQTMLERYGVEYTAQSPALQRKMQDTMLKKYHKKNYVETSDFQYKSQETCSTKYGVEYPCQLPQCKKALEEAVGHSKPEQDFAAKLDSYNISYEREYPIRGFKYDFKVDNTLFEIDPSSSHNANFGLFGNKPKSREYHYTKYSVAKEYGFHCVHVFDWDNAEKIIKTFILPKKRIFARQTELRNVPLSEAKAFLDENHLQGYAKDKIRLGLYHENELVEIMTFDKPRYNKNYEYELVRLCSTYNVEGGTEKILDHFIREHNPQNIISYCDLSKFSGKIYQKLGFKIISRSKPNKHWVNLKTGQHITNNLLMQRGFDQLFKTNYGKGTSNEQLMLENGFVEVYDCGQLTFIKDLEDKS